MQIKQLQWKKHNELNGIYATTNALKWSYSILITDDNGIKLALLDSYFEYAPGYPMIYSSIIDAQNAADQHYKSLLSELISP